MNRIGKRQARLLAREVGPFRLIWGSTHEDRRALKRLEARGIVRPALGWPQCWEVIS